jgi:hypothetical protein
MNLASDQSASNTPAVADFLPQLADTQSALVENLESLPPRCLDRARTTLKGLTGQSKSVSARWLKFELARGRLLAAADATGRGSGASWRCCTGGIAIV